MNPLVKLESVGLSLPGLERPILQQINLTIQPGDFIVLMGTNGSGKSSLLKTISGQRPHTHGMMEISAHMQGSAVITQDVTQATFGQLTVRDNCRLALKQSGARLDQSELLAYLRAFHSQLPHRMDTLVSQLSGGQRQCLALAMAMMGSKDLLLLDEHTSALDPVTAAQIMALTAELMTDNPNMAIVMTTHRMEEALRYGNRLLLMHEGRLVVDANEQEKARLSHEELLTLYTQCLDHGHPLTIVNGGQ